MSFDINSISVWLGIAASLVTIGIIFGPLKSAWKRNFSHPILTFAYDLNPVRREVGRDVRKKPLTLLFICLENEGAAQNYVPVLFHVSNNSTDETIAKVSVQLEFPSTFLISNAEISKVSQDLEKYREHFPAERDAVESSRRILEVRETQKVKDRGIVRYDFGDLRPGEGIVQCEYLRVRPKSPRLSDSRFDGKLYEKIANDILREELVVNHCIIKTFIFSEKFPLNPPPLAVTVLQFNKKDEEEEERILNSFVEKYVNAHWIGGHWPSGLYLTLPSLFRTKKLMDEQLGVAKFISQAPSIKHAVSGDKALIFASAINPLDTEHRYFSIPLPSYDYLDLPATVRSMQEAFWTKGIFGPLTNKKKKTK